MFAPPPLPQINCFINSANANILHYGSESSKEQVAYRKSFLVSRLVISLSVALSTISANAASEWGSYTNGELILEHSLQQNYQPNISSGAGGNKNSDPKKVYVLDRLENDRNQEKDLSFLLASGNTVQDIATYKFKIGTKSFSTRPTEKRVLLAAIDGQDAKEESLIFYLKY
mgnify:CR=1 FL=1